MRTTANEAPLEAGSPSISDLMAGLAQATLRDGITEMVRAQGRRGVVTLHVELQLSDEGRVTASTSYVHFEQRRHYKDARERLNDEA